MNPEPSDSLGEEEAQIAPASPEPVIYQNHFAGVMELQAPVPQVMGYLDNHSSWFRRCAQPMQVEPIGVNGYDLVIGRFGAFNYYVEPRISLCLLPQEEGIYRIETIPTDMAFQGYTVDFQAALGLAGASPEVERPREVTWVDWHLDLQVAVYFPRFMHRISRPLLQSTGDRLLRQIVHLVSRRLTTKVQEDFHTSAGIITTGVPHRSFKLG